MRYALLVLFLLSLASFACDNQKEQPLSSSARKEISQRYADTVRLLTPVVDSLCEVNRDKLVAQLADSLYHVRIADLNRQRKRFQQ